MMRCEEVEDIFFFSQLKKVEKQKLMKENGFDKTLTAIGCNSTSAKDGLFERERVLLLKWMKR